MVKIAVIGASSLSLGKTIIDEVLSGTTPNEIHLRLMSLHEEHMRKVAAYARRTDAGNDRRLRVTIHADTKSALEGADAVITAFDIGGMEASRLDHDVPASYGIGQCIGDTLGPGAVMRAQRVIPVIRSLVEEMSEASPDAVLLNYVNPIGPVAMAVDGEGWSRQIGLCRGPEDMLAAVGRLLGGRKLSFQLAGTNHMSWLLRISDAESGENLYPALKDLLLSPDIAGRERIRAEVLRTFGYFCSETSGHLSDMLPWFRNSEGSRRDYLGSGYAGETGIYPRVGAFLHRHLGHMEFLDHVEPDPPSENSRSLTRILRESVLKVERSAGGDESPVFGNLVNAKGRIRNLSEDAVVETVLAPRDGFWQPRDVLELPASVVGLTNRHVDENRLTAAAAVEGNPERLVQALALDPLCSSLLGLGAIREMARALLEAQREWIPQFAGKTVAPGLDFSVLPKKDRGPFDGTSAVELVRRYSKGS